MLTPTPQSLIASTSYRLGMAEYSLSPGTFYGHAGGVNGTASLALVNRSGTQALVVALNARGDADPGLVGLADRVLCPSSWPGSLIHMPATVAGERPHRDGPQVRRTSSTLCMSTRTPSPSRVTRVFGVSIATAGDSRLRGLGSGHGPLFQGSPSGGPQLTHGRSITRGVMLQG